MSIEETLDGAIARLTKETERKNGFDFRATGSLSVPIHANDQIALIRMNGSRGDMLLNFKVMRNVIPGVQHMMFFCIPENNPNSTIVLPDKNIVGANGLAVRKV